MTRRVAVFTGTRAEYGLLYYLMKDLDEAPDFDLRIIAGGAHFSALFGETWKDITADGFQIAARLDTDLGDGTALGTAQAMGAQLSATAKALSDLSPWLLIILGDRTEALAAASAALVMGVPVAHIHGGEITEGAYDDAIRHAITKIAQVHFAAADPYRRRILHMGEPPDRVFTVGALGLEHLSRTEPLDRAGLSQRLGFDLTAPYILATYHPETAADTPPGDGIATMLRALDKAAPDHRLVLTYPNADAGSRDIVTAIEAAAGAQPDRVLAVRSLGRRLFPSVLRHADAFVGNSSSGIIEAPAVGTPSVDIGQRQAGRLRAASIFHADPDVASIAKAIRAALARDWDRDLPLPYGRGGASAAILDVLRDLPDKLTKQFHDGADR